MSLFESILNADMISLITKVSVLLACFWFGKKALGGYRKKLNFFIRFIGSIVIGVFCYVTGIIISKSIPLPYVAEFIGAGISTVIVFVVLRLVSPVEDLDTRFVMRSEYDKLRDKFDKLKQRVAKIEKALSDKGLEPKPLSDKEVSRFVNNVLKTRGYGFGNVMTKKLSGNVFDLLVLSGKKKFDVAINAFSGDLIDFGRHSSGAAEAVKIFFEEIVHNKNYVIALIVFFGFLYFVAMTYVPSDYGRIMIQVGSTQGFDCPTSSDLESLFSQGTSSRYDLVPSQSRDATIEQVLGTSVNRNVYGYDYAGDRYVVVETGLGTCSINLNQTINCGCI